MMYVSVGIERERHISYVCVKGEKGPCVEKRLKALLYVQYLEILSNHS